METVENLIRRQASRGDELALRAPGRQPMSYGQLDRLTGEAAEQLRELGVSRTHRLAIAMATGPEAIACLLTVMRQAIAIPLNPECRAPEFEKALTFLRVDCLLVDAENVAAAQSAAASLNIPVIRVVVPQDAPAGSFTFETCARLGPPVQWTEQQLDDVAIVMQTSGTTGEPKRVPLTHANLTYSAGNSAASFGPADCLLGSLPLHHIAGVTLILITLCSGSSLCGAPGSNSARFLDWMDECRPTWIFAVPAVLRKLVEHARRRPDVIERCPLRMVRSGAAAVPPQLMAEAEEVFRAPLLEIYGMTEAAPTITRNPIPPGRRKPGSAGLPVGTEVIVLDSSEQRAAPGEIGEVVVRGPNIMRGYEDDPEANRRAFWNGWFRTGDLGWFDEDGYLFLTGRLRELINRGGQKVSPAEVEEALAHHPDVLEVAVFPMPHEDLGEDVAAAVVLRPGANTAELDLRRFLTLALADFKVPARIVFVAEIPKTSGGKVRRLALAQELGAQLASEPKASPAAFAPPDSALERKLAHIWAEVLSMESIGIHDDFFELGGDSFSAAVLLAAVQAEFVLASGDLELIDFLEAPTIAKMAQAIEKAMPSGGGPGSPSERLPVIALQPHGTGLPFFFAPRADEDPFYLLPLARHLGTARPFYLLRSPTSLEQRGDYSLTQAAATFADAMRKIHPHGPYLIGGHCFGGIVAFETARQLRAAGEEIALLAIIDAPAPHYLIPGRHWRVWQANILRRASLHIRHRISRAERMEDWRFLHDSCAAMWRHVSRRLHNKGAAPPVEANIRGTNVRALRAYRAQPYPGRLVTMDAKDNWQNGSLIDKRLGWRDLATEGMERCLLDGSHATIVEEPFTAQTALVLDKLIREAIAAAELSKVESACVPA